MQESLLLVGGTVIYTPGCCCECARLFDELCTIATQQFELMLMHTRSSFHGSRVNGEDLLRFRRRRQNQHNNHLQVIEWCEVRSMHVMHRRSPTMPIVQHCCESCFCRPTSSLMLQHSTSAVTMS